MDPTSTTPAPPRRIVTGVTPSGQSVVEIDGAAPPSAADVPGMRTVWKTVGIPCDAQAPGDGPGALINHDGSHCTFIDVAPGSASPMHRTDSVDYGVVLFGILELELDDGSVTHLGPGDVVVQRGTMHKWYNRSERWSRMMFVLLPAKPITVEGKVLEPSFS